MTEAKNNFIHKDTNTIEAYKRDLTVFCDLINKASQRFVEAGLIESLDDFLCECFVRENLAPFKDSIVKAYEDEGLKQGTFLMRKEYKERAQGVLAKVESIYSLFLLDKQRRKIDGLRLDPYQRIPYVFVREGKATFDPLQIEKNFTHDYTSKKAQAFIERTRKLHAEMVAYDEDVRRIGGRGIGQGWLSFIAVSPDGVESVINWENLKNLTL